MWKLFNQTVKAVTSQKDPPTADLEMCSAAILALLVYGSWQRPGGAANMTVQDYCRAKIVVHKEKVQVITVKEHKTATKGAAKFTSSGANITTVKVYHDVIRLYLDPDEEVESILPGSPMPTAITNPTYLLQKLGDRLGVAMPTPTRVQKIAATTVVQSLEPQELAIVSRQMSHSMSTEKASYQAIIGDKHAAEAHLHRQSLTTAKVDSPKPSSSPRKVRQSFSKEETDTIKKHFADIHTC